MSPPIKARPCQICGDLMRRHKFCEPCAKRVNQQNWKLRRFGFKDCATKAVENVRAMLGLPSLGKI